MNYFEFIKKWAPPSQYPKLSEAFENDLQIVIDKSNGHAIELYLLTPGKGDHHELLNDPVPLHRVRR